MKIVIVPLNSDNYGYILIDEQNNECAFVDISSQPQEALAAIKKESSELKLKMILTTHKHWDHAGGNNQIKSQFPEIEIVGGRMENVEGCTRFVEDNEEFNFTANIKVKCLHTPGHTRGHISYFVESYSQKVLFTGDCLFIGGAGKFFEGTGEDMYYSLYEKISNLPKDTLIYCGHEYTLSNYKFALSIDSDNQDLINENTRALELRAKNFPTIPSSIEKELKTNPFMRVNEKSIKDRFSQYDNPIDILTSIRESKNRF